MRIEIIARLLVLVLTLGVSVAVLAMVLVDSTVEVHAAMPERGGWLTPNLTARLNEPLRLRLVSDDVVHGFAIGQRDDPPIDVLPGKPTEISLTFDKPGTYTFYCTRWCGPNHWRMRGTITVEGDDLVSEFEPVTPPLYVTQGVDLDAPHEVPVALTQKPSAKRGEAIGIDLPSDVLDSTYIRAHSPYEAWQDLQRRPMMSSLDDDDIWDLVAFLWTANTPPEALQSGKQLYDQNCAACHGVTGAGNGVFATDAGETTAPNTQSPELGQETLPPTDFADPALMLGASSSLLQGKILRGGMGTGMPSWGLILTEEQTWKLTDYLWTFVFNYEE